MKTISLIAVAACSVVALALGVVGVSSSPEYVRETYQDRVIYLPEDGGKWYLTLMTHEDWRERPEERWVMAMMAHPALASLERQTKTFHYTPKHRYFRERLKWAASSDGVNPELPVMMLQDSDGRVVWKAAGEDLYGCRPIDLVKRIVQKIRQWRPFRPRPGPGPTPQPDEPYRPNRPYDPYQPPFIPDVDVDVETEESSGQEIDWPMTMGVVIGGLAFVLLLMLLAGAGFYMLQKGEAE